MPRYKLTIAYDGTRFCGWQKQEPPSDAPIAPEKVIEPGVASAGSSRLVLRTVQEVVERAVREVVREPVVLIGASRTDSGVHARGQVAAFTCGGDSEMASQRDSETGRQEPEEPASEPQPAAPRGGWPLSRGTDRLILALNSRLPEDVLITAAEPVAGTFDPIGDCTAKGYSYMLHVCPTRPLWDRCYVHHVWTALDLGAMNDAAARFVGEHDFAAFAAAGHGRLSTVRTVFECRVVEESETASPRDRETGARRLRIEVSGNGFLWNMVRIMAGTLVDVGLGRKKPDAVTAAIAGKDRRLAGSTMPAHGLCLEWVRY